MENTLPIQSKSHPYEVVFQDGDLRIALESAQAGEKCFFLVDQRVHELYRASFAGVAPPDRTVLVEASEEQKSYDALSPLFCRLIEGGFRRDCKLVVVGGGVLQDIGCFIASVLNRGVRWELIPTTLLAQADSCIGGKSSLNIQSFKNLLGTFYPPHQIWIVPSVLKTLSDDDVRSGLGEIIKIAWVEGDEALSRCREHLARYAKDKSTATLGQMTLETLKIKKRFIEEDEFDRGIRNYLNYGHTFGHAYESATEFGIPHGIAVLIGMSSATFFSERTGRLPEGSARALDEWIRPYYAPFHEKLRRCSLESVLKAMRSDKKNTGGKVNFILTRGAGRMEKVGFDPEKEAAPLLSEYLKGIA